MPDTQVVDVIRATNERDPRIHRAAQLAVSERAGSVTLRDTVRSLHQRRVATARPDGSVPTVATKRPTSHAVGRNALETDAKAGKTWTRPRRRESL
jgi:hypothetical protein